MRQLYVRFLLSHRWWALAYLLITVLHICTRLILPVMIAQGIANLFSYQSLRAGIFQVFPEQLRPDSIQNWFLLFFILLILKGLLSVLEGESLMQLGERFSLEMRQKLFNKQIRILQHIYDNEGTGKFLLRWSGGLSSLNNGLTKGYLRFMGDIFLLIACMGCICVFAADICLWPLSGVALLGLFSALPGRLAPVLRAYRARQSDALRHVHERMLAISSLRAFQRQNMEQKHYQKRSAELMLASFAYRRLSYRQKSLFQAAVYLPVLLLFAGILYTPGTSPDAAIIACLLLVSMAAVFRRILRASFYRRKAAASWARLKAFLRLPEEESGDAAAEPMQTLTLFPTLAGPGQHESPLNVMPGEERLLQAPTELRQDLMRIFSGLYKAPEGLVRVNDTDISAFSPRQMRRQVAVVSAQFPLAGRSLLEAVCASKNLRSRERALAMMEACQQLLPPEQRLDPTARTPYLITDISPVQRQIAILVRALYRQRPVLVAELPYAELPAEVEAYVRSLMAERLKQGKINLIIEPG
jgi:ABC-type multidrug transport system fused ATPase/permease subunit